MVDYTKDTGRSGGNAGIYFGAALVVLVLLYALFAGGGTSTNVDPAPVATEPAPAIISE